MVDGTAFDYCGGSIERAPHRGAAPPNAGSPEPPSAPGAPSAGSVAPNAGGPPNGVRPPRGRNGAIGFKPEDGNGRVAVVPELSIDEGVSADTPADAVANGGALDREANAGGGAATAALVGASSVKENAVARGTAIITTPIQKQHRCRQNSDTGKHAHGNMHRR
jgi:hypothetical protein